MKRTIGYIRNIFITIISVIIIFIVFSQTKIFKDFLRDVITDELNKNIDGQILISDIGGNLFFNIEIKNISLIKNNLPVISIKKIILDYNPLSLIQNIINIHSLLIDSIDLNLIQLKDSTWNISTIFKTPKDTSSGAFTWTILLDEVKVRNSIIKVSLLDETSKIPNTIENINLALSGFYSAEKSSIQLKKLSFDTVDPDVVVNDFHLTADVNNNELQISNIYVETQLNKIYANGSINLDSLNDLRVEIKTEPIHLSEFNNFATFKLNKLSPSITLKLYKKDKNIILESTLNDKKQQVQINANLSENPYYEGSADIIINNLNLAEIFDDKTLDGVFNGNFSVKGNWKNLDDYQIDLKGALFNSNFLKRKISSSIISAELNKGDLNSYVNLSGDFGAVNIEAAIDKIFSNPTYSFQSNLKHVNLSKIFLVDSLDSDLNLTINGTGKSFNPNYMSNNLQIFSNETSRINKYIIDSLIIKARKEQDYYLLDSLFIKNYENEITAKGEYRNPDSIKSEIQIVINNFDNLKHFTNVDTLYGNLKIKAEVSGLLDSLNIKSDFGLSDFHYNNVFLKSLNGSANAVINNSNINGDFNFFMDEVRYDSINLKMLQAEGNYKNNQLNLETNFTFSDSIKTNVVSSFIIDSTINIIIHKLAIKNGDNLWQNNKGTISFSIDKNTYLLKNFNLQSDSGYISIDAEINNDKYLSADIIVHSVELSRLLISPETKFSGLIDFNVKAIGDINDPEATGNLKISKLKIDQYNFGDITTGLNIKDKKLRWDLLAIQEDGNKVRFVGNMPVNFSSNNASGLIDEEKEFEAELSIKNLNLTNIKFVSNYFDEISGTINCNISASNNLQYPKIKGSLELSKTNIKINKLGVDYKDILIKLESDLNKIIIDTASFVSNKGKITVSGYLGSTTNILRGKLDDNDINLHSSNFELLNGKGINVLLEGDLRLYSENHHTRFDGDLKIPRSSFYLPSLKQSQPGNRSDAPLLIQALSRNDQTIIKDVFTENASPILSVFGEDINGKIKILIPDNAWIKSPNINIELKGDLIIEKINNDVVLNGQLKTGRGNLYYYGKKFNVTKGKLIFKEDKSINPYIDLTIEYAFRTPTGEKEKLIVDVTNTLDNPQITFTHNYEKINEADAISLIVFGIKTESLSQSQQSKISNSQDLVSNAVAGFLAAELSSKIGNKIGLDVLEISGDENWEMASLTAGNYLTEDLFVSYERSIPLGNSNEIETNKLITEYELLDYLFLQLIGGNSNETGINLIIKFD